MKTTTMYEADDGNMFCTEEECAVYEQRQRVADAVERTMKSTMSLVGWRGGSSVSSCLLRGDFPVFIARNWQALEVIVRSARKAAS
jgi:hypothetical protein